MVQNPLHKARGPEGGHNLAEVALARQDQEAGLRAGPGVGGNADGEAGGLEGLGGAP